MKTISVLFIVALSISQNLCQDAKEKVSAPAENVICKKCNCDAENKVIECSNQGMTKMFTLEEWAALNATKDNYEVLKLDHNKLEEIDVAFPALRFALKVIDFRHNKIKKIAKNAFTNLTYLEEINLGYNELTSDNFIPEIFEGKYDTTEFQPLKSLKRLILSSNLLHFLDSQLFEHTKHLQELYLDNNPFQILSTHVVESFGDLSQLQKLDLSRMELSDLPIDTFQTLRALKVLKLDGNLFKKIPEALKQAINLKELSLSENPIGDLNEQNFLPPLKKLEKLNMTYMGSMLVIGKGALAGLESLQELRLSNNHHLSYIHPSAFTFPEKDNPERLQWPQVKKLWLEYNNLSSIGPDLLINWEKMDEIHIHNNPFMCDCELEWVTGRVMTRINQTTPHLIDHIKCAEPPALAGVKLLDLNQEHTKLRCQDKFGAHPERDSALLVALMIGVLLGIPLAFASIMIYKRSCTRRGPADFSRAFYKRADMQEDVHI